ncbi:MAG: type II secretion system major pseudopilin GspG [Oceanicoccus sp.]|uniref:type II secretion system major pseudopilin GspG n=1 Tax=Oceanicoccus sp. TaxID=2691044 RepID=UPI00260C7C28|nr:type II secretion system major pseudopilin GspG [Oceanicoccus sp.]MCP3908218.1 type II secretion system major pseudopilin GspG [Oceanicoccus sp.]
MKKQSGFSLIEIMVVLVIIGLLVSIVAPNVLDQADDARVQKVKADFSAIDTSLSMYRLNNFSYPTSEQGLEALVEKPTIDPVPNNWKKGGYLKNLPLDPWGRAYLYLSPAEFSDDDYDIYSLGADGVSGGEDQNADIGSWMKKGGEGE